MKITLDYAAGVIDGEGTITLSRLHKTDKWRTPVVSVSSTTIEILNAFVAAFGGYICKHKVYKKHHLLSFSWRVAGRKAVDVCDKLKLLLLVPDKRHRAELIATKYISCTPRNGKYTNKLTHKKQQFENAFFHPSKP
jgi:hypothetical protein